MGLIRITAALLVTCFIARTRGWPSVSCSQKPDLEFVKDNSNFCGYYLCKDGSFLSDPASGNFFWSCAPGTSTKDATYISEHSPCITFDNKCKGSTYTTPGVNPVTNLHGSSGGTSGSDRTTASPFTSASDADQPHFTSSPPGHTTDYPNGHMTHGPSSSSYPMPDRDGAVDLQDPLEWYPGGHVRGGRLLTGFRIDDGPMTPVTTKPLCHWSCQFNESCIAFDWDYEMNACWIHTMSSACDAELLSKKQCEHVRLRTCGPNGKPKPTYGPHTPSSVMTSDSYSTAAPPSPSTPSMPPSPMPSRYPAGRGFIEKHVNGHMANGRIALTSATEEACLAFCLHFPTCAAVEFDNFTDTCWLHKENTACQEMMYKVGCTHFKRLPCYDHDMPPYFVSTFREGHLPGGSLLCGGCTETECKHRCLNDHNCAAIDYNSRKATCYKHLEAAVCQSLASEKGVTHFRRINCEGEAR